MFLVNVTDDSGGAPDYDGDVHPTPSNWFVHIGGDVHAADFDGDYNREPNGNWLKVSDTQALAMVKAGVQSVQLVRVQFDALRGVARDGIVQWRAVWDDAPLADKDGWGQ